MEGEIFVGSIKVKLPESWRENLYYEIEYNPNNTSSVIRFYEEPDHSDFGGGWLCSVIQMEGNNIEDYRHLPSFKYIGQIECPDGTIYGLIVEYPTDVQPSIEQMPRYFQMYDDIEQFIAGIEPLDVAELYYYVGGVGEYILPFSDIYKLNDSDLEELTEEELMVARNEIYARHGRLFKNPDLQEYFNARPWYNGQISSEAFDERVLSEVEKWNLQAIVSYEKTGSVGSGE